MKELFSQFKEGINVLKTANKLNSILFQFPPWFDLTKEHISRLQFIRDQFENFPIALEFRNRTWFENHVRQSTLAFMEKERWLHVICDEPQAGVGSIPTVLKVTNSQNTLIRFHGRNVNGWNNNGNKHWRKVRFLYRYSTDELNEWVNHLKQLQQHSEKITILFNNNSGGDAFRNAKQLQQMLGITYHDLNPKQIDMFTEDKF